MASVRNQRAGRLIRELRTDRGLSPEALSWAIQKAGHGFVSGRQIRRIEDHGVVPTPRVMFAIATYFERLPSEMWSRNGRFDRPQKVAA